MVGSWQDGELQRITTQPDSVAWQQKEGKNEQLTELDIANLTARKLDLSKASEVKALWVLPDISAKKAAEILGRGHRQVQDYWAAFNESVKK